MGTSTLCLSPKEAACVVPSVPSVLGKCCYRNPPSLGECISPLLKCTFLNLPLATPALLESQTVPSLLSFGTGRVLQVRISTRGSMHQ